jgi:hypothetical protein
MTTLITKRPGPHSRMEAEVDPVAEPWPMAFIGILALLVGDTACPTGSRSRPSPPQSRPVGDPAVVPRDEVLRRTASSGT